MSIEMRVGRGEDDRLDRWLRCRFPDAPRREIQALFDDGAVRVDGRRASKGDRVHEGDRIQLGRAPASRGDLRPVPDGGPLDVVLETTEVVAIGKTPGIPTHPLRAGEGGTAANLVAARYPECAHASDDPREGGAVHRLDAGTSGVLLFARTRDAYRALRAAFTAGQVHKEYLALTRALPDRPVLDEPLAQRGMRVVPSPEGLACATRWDLRASAGGVYLLSCSTDTGRMHQIRAHLAGAGAPLVGDALYGGEPGPASLVGFFLHALELTTTGPDVPPVRARAPLPGDRRAALAALGLSPAAVEGAERVSEPGE